ncbi:putative membrane protein [Nocardia transvalensis]|uniref:Putative membrane protein n=1 Tax=Nocardia transvalensis TaxID=37333 RepID=A0A7W9PEF4_9NOCA|nr:SPW repeat protein [Nocardia transvalensis]MBB5914540.1 putative membrane protein [Nocardia transvalensis]
MFSESRAQDFVAVVLGVFTALSPLWVDTSTRAAWTLIVLGVLIALTGLAQLARPAMAGMDYAMGVLGVLLFVSPWVMNFHDFTGASWTAWIVGVLTVVAAVAALPQVTARLHTAH